jgi:hypothetical protein
MPDYADAKSVNPAIKTFLTFEDIDAGEMLDGVTVIETLGRFAVGDGGACRYALSNDSQPLYGPELSEFPTVEGQVNWTRTGGWAFGETSGALYLATQAAGTATFVFPVTMTTGRYYRIRYQIAQREHGSLTVSIYHDDGSELVLGTSPSSGLRDRELYIRRNAKELRFTASSNFDGRVTQFLIEELLDFGQFTVGSKTFVPAADEIHAEQFGLKGDGSTNDDAPFRRVVNFVNRRGGNARVKMPGDYPLIAEHKFIVSGVHLDFMGTGSIITETDDPALDYGVINFEGDGPSDRTEAAADIPAGATSISVADATNYAAGDVIAITSNFEYWSGIDGAAGFRIRHKGELAILRSVSGNVLTLEGALRDSYSVPVNNVEKVYVRRLAMLTGIRVSNGKAVGQGGGDTHGTGNPTGVQAFRLDCVSDFRIEDFRFENFPRFAMISNLGIDHRAAGCTFQGRLLTDPTNRPYISRWFTGWLVAAVKMAKLSECTAFAARRMADPDGMAAGYFDNDNALDVLTHDIIFDGTHHLACVTGPGGHLYDTMVVSGGVVDSWGPGVSGLGNSLGVNHRGKNLYVRSTVFRNVNGGIGVGYGSVGEGADDPGNYTEVPSAGVLDIDADIQATTVGISVPASFTSFTLRGRVRAPQPLHFIGKYQDNVDISGYLEAVGDDFPVIHAEHNDRKSSNVWRVHDAVLKGGSRGVDLDAITGAPMSNLIFESIQFSGQALGCICFGTGAWGPGIVVRNNDVVGSVPAYVQGAASISGYRENGNSWNPTIIPGSGSPEGVVAAPVGSLFVRIDGSLSATLYVKENGAGATGWAAK